jgi:hypothetical protein
MINPFNIPYNEKGSFKNKLSGILVFGLFIFLFLYFFKPFGLSLLKPILQLPISFGFGLITFFILFVYNFLIGKVIIRNRWSLGKNILYDILIASSVGLANFFYIHYIFPQEFTFKYLFYFIWTAILVGSIPVTIKYFINFNRMYKNALKDAAIPEENVYWEDEVNIMAGNQKNDNKFNPKEIIYLCSNDNYVTIVTIKSGIQNKTTIRGTLKSAESELRKNNRFLRCHKCYIVNLDFVERVTGHNQNMKIRLLPSGMEIPVSRSRVDLVNKRTKKN